MILSKACEYALRATLHLVTLKPDSFVSIRAISDDLDISFPFLTKIFQKLTQAGILHSFRGPNGGIALARSAAKVTLFEIVVAVDGIGMFRECVLGLPGCGERKPCPLHDRWAVERERMKAMFEAETLADMAERLRGDDLRLVARPVEYRSSGGMRASGSVR